MYDVGKIYNVITSLKKIKKSSFSCNNGPVNFLYVKETCRMIDTLMLPLYYIWEHCCHQQLEDLSFEEHLRNPYKKFLQHPITYTWQLYVFITIKEPLFSQLKKKSIYNEISFIYKELIKYFEKGEKDVRL